VAKTPSKTTPARKPATPKTAGAKAASKASASRAAAKTGTKAAKKPTKAAAEKATILTLRHLAERLSEAHELPQAPGQRDADPGGRDDHQEPEEG
jgi:DNA-binding protein HU-beta